jgi:CBS domain-containing protein
VKQYKVKDLMVPKSEYAVILEDTNIYEAVMALEKAQEEFDATRYRHRGVLVENKKHKIVGKLGQLDILRSLEPKYEEMRDESKSIIKYGFSRRFLLSMLESYKLFDKPLDDICKKAGHEKVSKYMHRPTEGECIDEGASLDEAIHLLVVGHHQSLLVLRNEDIVGVLRLTDVFAFVFHTMKACGLEA